MKKMALLMIVGIFGILSGCATTPRPTAEQINMANCGPLPSNHEVAIKMIIDPHLFDPYSAVYTFSKPEKAWNNMAGDSIYGWRVCGTINAKNRFGGYIGSAPFYAFFNNDKVVRFITKGITIPDSFKLGMLSDNSGFYNAICR